jgi:hypothetical protein
VTGRWGVVRLIPFLAFVGARGTSGEGADGGAPRVDAAADGAEGDGAFPAADGRNAATAPFEIDGEAGPGVVMTCDELEDVSPSGDNPFGIWSYRTLATASAPFVVYANYFASIDDLSVQPVSMNGVMEWTASAAGDQVDPAAFFNAGAMQLVEIDGAGSTTATTSWAARRS